MTVETLILLANAAVLVFWLGWLAGRAHQRRRGCRHEFGGPRQLVRVGWMRQCEHCGHAEMARGPVPQPTPERRR
jgi:hypothetical protein